MSSNELYSLCSSSTLTSAKLTEILTRKPKLAEETDEDGYPALTYLCQNDNVTLFVSL